MSTEYTGREERRHTAEVFRDKWVWLVLLGSVLIVAAVALILHGQGIAPAVTMTSALTSPARMILLWQWIEHAWVQDSL